MLPQQSVRTLCVVFWCVSATRPDLVGATRPAREVSAKLSPLGTSEEYVATSARKPEEESEAGEEVGSGDAPLSQSWFRKSPAVKWPTAETLAFEFSPLNIDVAFSGQCAERTCVMVGGSPFPISAFVDVSRPEIVPTFTRGKGDFPAKQYAYAKFGHDVNNVLSELTVGGFIYLDDEGRPIQEIRKLNHHPFGAMRFEPPVEVTGWNSIGAGSPGDALEDPTPVPMALVPNGKPYWFRITVGALADAGIGYYTWVVTGDEIQTRKGTQQHTGGFMYAVKPEVDVDTPPPRFYPMKSSNAACNEGTVIDGRFNGYMATADETSMDYGLDTRPKYDYLKYTPNTYATRYDYWLDTMQYAVSETWDITENTVLFVIDMQNDFVWGTFQQPCVAKRNELVDGVVQMINKAASVGATIIASVDYHSVNHCSFQAVHQFNEALACKNEFILNVDVKNSSNGEDRYKNNAFPAHTWWQRRDDSSVPSHGALLAAPVRQALANAKGKAKVHTIFKGFQDGKDSFSAVPHFPYPDQKSATGGQEYVPEAGTGGYALEAQEADDTDFCYSFTTVTLDVIDRCFPKVSQMADPDGEDSQMIRVDKLLDGINGNTQVIVTGLVHDFCVKETAIYMKRLASLKMAQAAQRGALASAADDDDTIPALDVSVVVHVDYARPALEGLGLGSPLTIPGLEGPVVMPPDILGTAMHMDNTAAHLKQYGVGYIRNKRRGRAVDVRGNVDA